jgi:hypothetical protein
LGPGNSRSPLPCFFNEEHKETYSAHELLHQQYQYHTQWNADKAEFSGSARMCVGESEQTWIDAEFGNQDVSQQKDFSDSLIKQYVLTMMINLKGCSPE